MKVVSFDDLRYSLLHLIMINFHSGCHGCTQQYKHGIDFCFDCCYFQADWSKPGLNNEPSSPADWSKPGLNNEPSSPADLARQRVIDRRNIIATFLYNATKYEASSKGGEEEVRCEGCFF